MYHPQPGDVALLLLILNSADLPPIILHCHRHVNQKLSYSLA